MSSLECKGGGLSVFTKGDLIAAYPKEGAVLFVGVVVISVVLENLLGAFRENRSRYVMRLYVQVNEEVMILGIIGLMFVFVEQSLVSYLPAHWVLLLQWVQAVLFCLAVFVIFGVVYTAAVTHAVVPWLGAKVTCAGPDLSQVIQHEQLLLAERQRQREAQRADRRIAIDEARAAHAAVSIGDRSAAEPRRVSDANQNGNGQGRRSSSTTSGAYPPPPHRRKSSSSFAAATQAQAWRDATLKIDADADDAADAHEDLLRSAAIGGGRLAKQNGSPMASSSHGQQTTNRGPARGLSIFGETVRSVVSGNGRPADDSFANAGNAGPARQTADYDEEYTARLTAEATRRPTLAAGGPLTRIRLALAFAYGNHLLTQQGNNQAAASTSTARQRNGGQNVGNHGSNSGNRNAVGRPAARPQGGRNILADPRQAADDAIADAAPLQQYLLARHRDTVVSFADVTWQCWLSVVFLAGLNGFRLYFLPANRDGRDPAMYTDDDRLQNTLTFVFLVGWLPAVAYLIAVSLIFRHFWRYVRSVERSERQHRFAAKLASSTQHRSRMATAHTAAFGGYMDPHSAANLNTLRGAEISGHRTLQNGSRGYPNDGMDLDEGDGGQEGQAPHASPRGGGGGRSSGAAGGHGSGIGVWLPPRHIVEHMTTSIGSMDDPSLYLLRGHKGFTVHMLKIPLLLIQLYLSFFVAGQWGVVAQTFGPRQAYITFLALLPVIVLLATLPLALCIVSILTAFGTRFSPKDARKGRQSVHRRRDRRRGERGARSRQREDDHTEATEERDQSRSNNGIGGRPRAPTGKPLLAEGRSQAHFDDDDDDEENDEVAFLQQRKRKRLPFLSKRRRSDAETGSDSGTYASESDTGTDDHTGDERNPPNADQTQASAHRSGNDHDGRPTPSQETAGRPPAIQLPGTLSSSRRRSSVDAPVALEQQQQQHRPPPAMNRNSGSHMRAQEMQRRLPPRRTLPPRRGSTPTTPSDLRSPLSGEDDEPMTTTAPPASRPAVASNDHPGYRHGQGDGENRHGSDVVPGGDTGYVYDNAGPGGLSAQRHQSRSGSHSPFDVGFGAVLDSNPGSFRHHPSNDGPTSPTARPSVSDEPPPPMLRLDGSTRVGDRPTTEIRPMLVVPDGVDIHALL